MKRFTRKALLPLAAALFGFLHGSGNAAEEVVQPQAETIAPPAAHAKLPVIFWAHYMPQVSPSNLHAGGHPRGNSDATPFMTEDGTTVEQCKRMIKAALASGINGFQLLTILTPEMLEAGKQVVEETGTPFYLAPEWCGQGEDPVKAGKQIAEFAVKYQDHPCLFRIDGKQLHFTYNHGKWSGTGTWEDSSQVPLAREEMKKAGVDVLIVPTGGNYEKRILGRHEMLYRSWPDPDNPKLGDDTWLRDCKWDGMTALNSTNIPYGIAKAVTKRVNEVRPSFLVVPSINAGYDSSNRTWQAIHCRYSGVRRMTSQLRQWIELGYKQFTFSTWNDPNETMLLPSSRGPYGYADILRYYHALAETGHSPFDAPRFVVAYDPEVMLGDQMYFQCLFLPEINTRQSEYITTFTLRDLNDQPLMILGVNGRLRKDNEEALEETRFDTSVLDTSLAAVVPYVTVRRSNVVTGESETIYNNLRLPPVILRYNKIHFFPPYTISLAHVLPGETVDLKYAGIAERATVAATGSLLELQSTAALGDKKLRKLVLNESCLSLGSFRDNSTGEQPAEEQVTVFLSVKASRELDAELSVGAGSIHDMYRPFWNEKQKYKEINASSIKYKTLALLNNHGGTRWCFRITAGVDDPIRFAAGGAETSTTIREMAAYPACRVLKTEGDPLEVRLELTTDMTEMNIDFPIEESGTYTRTLHVDPFNQPSRVIFAWGLTEDGMVCYSRPLVLTRQGVKDEAMITDPAQPVAAAFIQTGGIFDDFVNDSSSRPANPFTQDNVIRTTIPAAHVPYSVLDMEEGSGAILNDSGTGNQIGRCWIVGDCAWEAKGWRGSALRLAGGKIKFKSKSMPHGAFTFSARVSFDKRKGHRQVLLEDGDFYNGVRSGPISLLLNADGKLEAHRYFTNHDKPAISDEPVPQGWCHITAVYDLGTLTLYLNGEEVGKSESVGPSYQRTHSTPEIGFSSVKADDEAEKREFKGLLDQVELIGTALSADEIRLLFQTGQWLSRR